MVSDRRLRSYSMRVLRQPERVSGLIFDIDNTLYRNSAYLRAQADLLVERLAAELGDSVQRMGERVDAVRRIYAARTGGDKPSLANTFLEFGVDIGTSARWREELYHPEEYLGVDRQLQCTLQRFASEVPIVAVTNNPRSIGVRTLECLGVSRWFRGVVGLDDSGVSKPHATPFLRGLALLGDQADERPEASEVVSVGDRIEVDLNPAMELGMGAVYVESMEDVYELPHLLLGAGEHAR